MANGQVTKAMPESSVSDAEKFQWRASGAISQLNPSKSIVKSIEYQKLDLGLQYK